MKASSPHATSLSARQTHQFIVVTCGLLELRSVLRDVTYIHPYSVQNPHSVQFS